MWRHFLRNVTLVNGGYVGLSHFWKCSLIFITITGKETYAMVKSSEKEVIQWPGVKNDRKKRGVSEQSN